MNVHTADDRFLSLSAWFGAVLYAAPAIIIAITLAQFPMTKEFVVPSLLVYLTGAIAHMVTYGLQAICVQIKVATDHAINSTKTASFD